MRYGLTKNARMHAISTTETTTTTKMEWSATASGLVCQCIYKRMTPISTTELPKNCIEMKSIKTTSTCITFFVFGFFFIWKLSNRKTYRKVTRGIQLNWLTTSHDNGSRGRHRQHSFTHVWQLTMSPDPEKTGVNILRASVRFTHLYSSGKCKMTWSEQGEHELARAQNVETRYTKRMEMEQNKNEMKKMKTKRN